MTKKIKILVIDDEDIVLQSTKRILANDDFEVDTASSGEEGLQKVKEDNYDIVITDLMMPGMGGMDVLKILKKDYPDITVIIFTGFATVESAREGLKNGAFDYIPKPFTPDELRDVVYNSVKAREEDSGVKMLDLMAIVSHELKSPISVVHTSAETLYKGYFGNLQPEQQKTVEAILRNCQYLEDMIRNYIDMMKTEMDSVSSFKDRIDLVNDVIKPVIEMPEFKKNMKNMSIVSDFKVQPEINADINLLKIVVTNFLSNAIKYGKEDSIIIVDLYEEDSKCVFSIFNEGVGVKNEDIEKKLFKKFSRLKDQATGGVKGSGLGLYICKKIIEKHDGEIWVESEYGKGITFYFSLPILKS